MGKGKPKPQAVLQKAKVKIDGEWYSLRIGSILVDSDDVIILPLEEFVKDAAGGKSIDESYVNYVVCDKKYISALNSI